jgi:uncharacterized protein (DUF427 family)
VSLTSGRGPLSANPAGHFSAPVPTDVVYVEPHPRRVRALRTGSTVVDADGVLLVHRPGAPPTYALPAAAVAGIDCEPVAEAPGHVAVAWDAVDAWYEEEEQVFMHPRNPYHRVDCVTTARRLQVAWRGVRLVDTTDTVGLYETSLAPRLYVDRRHLLVDLVPSATGTYCPYKGTASYWSVMVGGETVDDVAWSYEDPYPESLAIAGLVSFDDRRVAVETELPGWTEDAT